MFHYFSVSGAFSSNIACDELNAHQKQKLCDEAMIDVVAHERNLTRKPGQLWNDDCRDIRVDEFLDAKSDLPVPSLVDENDPYKCKKIPIEGMMMRKNMYWCKSRVFTYWSAEKNDGTDSVANKFISDESDSDDTDSDKNYTKKTDSMQSNSMKTTPMLTNSKEKIAQAEGFFITSSKETYDTAFIFKPSPTDRKKVIIYAELCDVSLLKNAAECCDICRK